MQSHLHAENATSMFHPNAAGIFQLISRIPLGFVSTEVEICLISEQDRYPFSLLNICIYDLKILETAIDV